MKILRGLVVSIAWFVSSSVFALPGYRLVTLGLFDRDHSPTSQVIELTNTGQVVGTSPHAQTGTNKLGTSAWIYSNGVTSRIGLSHDDLNSTAAYQSNKPLQLNDAGHVIGYYRLYSATDTELKHTSWIYDGTATIQIGLTGPEFTRGDGYQYSHAWVLNRSGHAIGFADRFGSGSGRSAWIYDGASTIELGLDGDEFISNGYKYTDSSRINSVGQAIGTSTRFSAGAEHGSTAWIFDRGASKEIGLSGAAYTGADGYRYSAPYQINDDGQVVGCSARFFSQSEYGYDTWLYDGQIARRIGLFDTEHTSDRGYQFSVPAFRGLNEAGQVVGTASRYNGSNEHGGDSIWFFDGANTTKIGMTDSEHTRNDGYKSGLAIDLTESGYVVGYSDIFHNAYFKLGRSAWLYDGVNTTKLGFTHGEHSVAGHSESSITDVNEKGHVIGYSTRYRDVYPLQTSGATTWLYDGSETIQLGLVGSEFAAPTGEAASFANRLNEAGQVVGFSYRYDAKGSYAGKVAWFYDPSLDQTIPFRFPPGRDGRTECRIRYLGEDGVVLGHYTTYGPSGYSWGERAFYFSLAHGLHDLGSLVEGGLSQYGWNQLTDILKTNSQGLIAGPNGFPYDVGDGRSFLLLPIPEPNSATLAVVMLSGLAIFRFRGVRTEYELRLTQV